METENQHNYQIYSVVTDTIGVSLKVFSTQVTVVYPYLTAIMT